MLSPWHIRQAASTRMPRARRSSTPAGTSSRMTAICDSGAPPVFTASWKESRSSPCQPPWALPGLRLRPATATRPRRTPCVAITSSAMRGAWSWQKLTAPAAPSWLIAARSSLRRRSPNSLMAAWPRAWASGVASSAGAGAGAGVGSGSGTAAVSAAGVATATASGAGSLPQPASIASASTGEYRVMPFMHLSPVCGHVRSAARNTAAGSPPASARSTPGCRRSAQWPGH